MAKERIQRRLAAILATDVVGYSRLMGADEAGTLARLNALRSELLHPKVSEYGGRIVKTTGDGTLIEFPSAVDAVQHAVDVQQALARRNADLLDKERIEMRMGVNLGDIIVQGEDIFGDGVNVAARLEALAEPGGIYVSGTVFDQVRGRIDVEVEALGERPLKNMDAPVRLYRLLLGTEKAASSGPDNDTSAILERPAVAVLPFSNMSGDEEQEYFTDGLTEDIITALTAWNSFPVIGRNSSFVYKGMAVKLQQVGAELGARYVVEGSVRKIGNRVRVTAQLIDARTGTHVWANRYDRELSDIFEVQDEITYHVVAALVPEIERAESRRVKVKLPSNMDAWDYYLRGLSYQNEVSRTANARAREMFERAIAIDPDYAKAYANIALTYHRDLYMQITTSPEDTIKKFLAAAQRAVELDDSDSLCHWVLALAHLWPLRHDIALAEAERAKHLNPTDLFAQNTCGTVLLMYGRPKEAISEIEAAIRFNPLDARNRVFLSLLARAYLDAKQYERAGECARKALVKGADFLDVPLILASSLGHLGKAAEARVVLRDLVPNFDPAKGLGIWWQLYSDTGPNEHLREGLRKAGWEG